VTNAYLSMRIVKVATLATWRPRYLHKTYLDVEAVTRVLRYPCGGNVCSERGVQHWDMLRGRWYAIFNWH
jgi:hypothetical protein